MPRRGWLAALRDAVGPEGVGVAGGPVLPVWPERRVPALFRTHTGGDFLSMLDLGARRIDLPRVLPGNVEVDREATGEDIFAVDRGRRESSLAGAEEIAMMPGCRPSVRGSSTRRWPSVEKARRLIGWEAKIDLQTGLRGTVEWLRESAPASAAVDGQ